MTDFVKITLATDRVRPTKIPDTWKIQSPTLVAVALGFCMMLEALSLLWVGSRFTGIKIESHEVHTFSFLILLFMALFSILCIRERGHFWKSRPSSILALALFLDGAIGLIVGWRGLGVLPPIPVSAIGIAHIGAIILSFGFNDFLKLIFYRMATSSITPSA